MSDTTSTENMADFYEKEYIRPRLTPQNHQPTQPIKESINDFELDEEDLINETYYAGGDEKPAKGKKKKAPKKESFMDLADRFIREEFDEFDDDLDDDYSGGDFEDFDADFDSGDEGTIEISTTTIRDIISQLQGLIGDEGAEDEEGDDFDDFDDFEEFEDDFESDDPFEDDDFPQESTGDCRVRGDYSGKANSLKKKSNLKDKSRANTKYPPSNTGGRTGDSRLKGDYSGNPKPLKKTNLKDKSRAKTGHKPTSDDLF